MPKIWDVEIARTYIGHARVQVLADNENQARRLALKDAGELEYSLIVAEEPPDMVVSCEPVE